MQNKLASTTNFNKAVLFLIFNRFETTKQVFEEIKKAKPPRFYIASDGARVDKIEEAYEVQEIRNFILDSIDWDCEVKTLFRDINLGCKKAVEEAIDWFFENEEMGIILEDDCLPCHSFFSFCEENLDKYVCDQRIFSITGNNFSKSFYTEKSYFFSRFIFIWGWATWRRSWLAHKKIMRDFDLIISKPLKTLSINHKLANKKIIDNAIKARKGEINTWDYQWILSNYLNNGLVITPKNNLVKNIGFGINATHTTVKNNNLSVETLEIETPLIHPIYKISNDTYDNFLYNHVFGWRSRFEKLIDFNFLVKKVITIFSFRD